LKVIFSLNFNFLALSMFNDKINYINFDFHHIFCWMGRVGEEMVLLQCYR
jgi:hypothetical protein